MAKRSCSYAASQLTGFPSQRFIFLLNVVELERRARVHKDTYRNLPVRYPLSKIDLSRKREACLGKIGVGTESIVAQWGHMAAKAEVTTPRHDIRAGTILISETAVLPESVSIVSKPYSSPWRTVLDIESSNLDRRIREAGWHFFFLAGEVKASVLGSNVPKGIQTAIARLSAAMKWQNFNSLQIACVEQKKFCGIPYVSVSAHWRHIQENIFLPQSGRSTKLQIQISPLP
jgi:hypothetical protein